MIYDVITVGGGLAGAALARVLAASGVQVLVLEREQTFKDRVRGDQMSPWGVAETRTLGLYELLKERCALEVRGWSTQFFGAPPAVPRDLVATSPHRAGSLNFYHPEMQSLLLAAAEAAGATVQRGATVVEFKPGRPASVRVRNGRSEHTYRARLVVGADGRTSGVRKWAGFTTRRDPERLVLAGALFEGLRAPQDTVHLFFHPRRGLFSLTAPLGRERFRIYAGYYKQDDPIQLSGPKAVGGFTELSVSAGTPATWFEGAEVAGPLASFEGADSWVDHPYHEGVALVGDAAASSDPSFGCGLSLTLRDVRVLSEGLLGEEDWDAAAHAYAAEHDRYYGALHRQLDWLTKLFREPGPEGEARRARALPLIAEDRSRVPDIVGLGPEAPSDEVARRRFFGED